MMATKNKKRNRRDSENPENMVCGNMAQTVIVYLKLNFCAV